MTRIASRGKPGARGFSMVELLVVVAIMAIAAAFSLPMISQYLRNYTIRGAAQQVTGALTQARGRAIGRNVNLGMLFYIEDVGSTGAPPTSAAFRVVHEDDLTAPFSGARRPLSDLLADAAQAGDLIRLPEGIVVDTATGTHRAMRFNRLGAACEPNGVGEPCPDIDVAGANGIEFDGPTNTFTITLRQPQTGLTRTITVTRTGRVRVEES